MKSTKRIHYQLVMAAEAAEVFIYMGEGGPAVPHNAVRVRVHPSVTVIPERAFGHRQKLEVVELHEGLLEIEDIVFYDCVELKSIKIPSTVTRIGLWSFSGCTKLEEIELNEGLINIGKCAFTNLLTLKQITIPTTVTVIDESVFHGCKRLERLELPEGLLEIRKQAFCNCNLKNINFPSTLKTVGESAFRNTDTRYFSLPDGIESIGRSTFQDSNIVKFRVPPLITIIPSEMLSGCRGMFSLELSENVTQIEEYALGNCSSLRNLALNPDNIIDENALQGCTNLLGLGSTIGEGHGIIYELQSRFDNLPIHRLIYYQSYNNMTVEQLNEATTMKKRVLGSKFNPTGNLQDRLGMTPLHIMACSTVQNIELYKVLVTKYPENLATKDDWGGIPLLYALWGNVPDEIIQFLVESYQSLYPGHEFNWTNMMKTLSVANAQEGCIQNLLDIQEEFYPEQSIDWDKVFKGLAEPTSWNTRYTTVALARHATSNFKFLVKSSISPCLNSVGLKQWRDDIITDIENIPDFYPVEDTTHDRNLYHVKRTHPLDRIKQKLSCYEDEYLKLKEATTMIELTLWKNKIYEAAQCKGRCKKKPKNELTARDQCRISCGADIVIEHVLPYLISVPANDSSIEIESEDNGSDSE